MKAYSLLRSSWIVAAVVLGGCQTTKPMYHYGSYQSNLYQMFKNENSSVPKQIDDLEKAIAETDHRQQAVGPGMYAHLGYLYIQAGQTDTGFAYLEKEKQLYPESTTYMDLLLKNARGAKP